MAKGGNGSGRTEENRELPHLVEEAGTQSVSANPGVDDCLAGQFRLRRGPLEELPQDWARLGFAAFEHRTDEHAGTLDEELLPENARLLETIGTKWLDLKTGTAQRFGGVADYLADCWHHWCATVIFEIADAEAPDFIFMRPAKRQGSGARVAVISTLHDFEENHEISYGTRHRTADTE